jgi:GNAT superfamily N-acetyltransferase
METSPFLRMMSTPDVDVVIRPCKDGDANRILVLMREVFIDELGWDRAFIIDAAYSLKEMLEQNKPGRDFFQVCRAEKKIVGVLFVLDVGGGTAFIRWLVVRKDFRGRGLGRELLDRALDFSGRAGFHRVRLVTVFELSWAREFYLRAGFREVARRSDILWKMEHDLCYMEMDVTA